MMKNLRQHQRNRFRFNGHGIGGGYRKWMTIVLAASSLLLQVMQIRWTLPQGSSQRYQGVDDERSDGRVTQSGQNQHFEDDELHRRRRRHLVVSSLSRLSEHDHNDDLSFDPPTSSLFVTFPTPTPTTQQHQQQRPSSSMRSSSGVSSVPPSPAKSKDDSAPMMVEERRITGNDNDAVTERDSAVTSAIAGAKAKTAKTENTENSTTVDMVNDEKRTSDGSNSSEGHNTEWMNIIWGSAVAILYNNKTTVTAMAIKNNNISTSPLSSSSPSPVIPKITRTTSSYDYHRCTSPEYNTVEWPFSEDKVVGVTTTAVIPKDSTNAKTKTSIAKKSTTVNIRSTNSVLDPSFTCAVIVNSLDSEDEMKQNKGKRKRADTVSVAATKLLSSSPSTFTDYFYDVIWKTQIQPLLLTPILHHDDKKATATPSRRNDERRRRRRRRRKLDQQQQRQQESTTTMPMQQVCHEMVVFGVAFGSNFVQQVSSPDSLQHINTTQLLTRHGSCFFMFTTVEDLVDAQMIKSHDNETITVGTSSPSHLLTPFKSPDHPFWWIPIPSDQLPYKNPRRNTKLLKYFVGGQFAAAPTLSSSTSIAASKRDGLPITTPRPLSSNIVIWQDAKFFRADMVTKQPRDDYTSVLQTSHDACLTAIGLPIHPNTVGKDHPTPHNLRLKQRYAHQCRAIVMSLQRRPNVTDSPHSLIYQCLAYLSALQKEEQQQQSMKGFNSPSSSLTSQLDYGLVDTAFLVWNESTERCRRFNEQFRCSIQSQLHCHSDRDQTNWPFVLMKMNVTGFYQKYLTNTTKVVNEWWDPRASDVEYYLNSELSIEQEKVQEERKLLQGKGGKQQQQQKKKVPRVDVLGRLEPVVRILRYNCHWYGSRIGEGCLFWKKHRKERLQ